MNLAHCKPHTHSRFPGSPLGSGDYRKLILVGLVETSTHPYLLFLNPDLRLAHSGSRLHLQETRQLASIFLFIGILFSIFRLVYFHTSNEVKYGKDPTTGNLHLVQVILLPQPPG